jgi:hypothetical protein
MIIRLSGCQKGIHEAYYDSIYQTALAYRAQAVSYLIEKDENAELALLI